jgi:serine/threonine-protein kinase
MWVVSRATDTKLKRQVALKVLPVSVAADPDRLAQFQREAELLASLRQPHSVQVSTQNVVLNWQAELPRSTHLARIHIVGKLGEGARGEVTARRSWRSRPSPCRRGR